jgi:Cytochrome c
MEELMTSAIFSPISVIAAFSVVIGLSWSPVVVAAQTQSADGQATASSQQGMQGQGMMGNTQAMPGMSNMRMPEMNSAKGRTLFVTKGCVACHSINNIGGHDAAKLDADTMEPMMNPFDFAAKMWRMAPAMIAAQEEELGEQILFTGDELSDIVAFVHDPEEQKKFTMDDLTPEARKMMGEHHHEGMQEEENHGEDEPHDDMMGGTGQ